ncbi:MAG: MarR family transcriptional regulator [Pseudomonadota bacterium]
MRAIDDPITFTVLDEIRVIEQLATGRLQRALPHGLELSQFAVLNQLALSGGEKSPAQLARAFQLTKGAMTNTVKRLQTRGLIRVRDDAADGRRKLISVTEAGRAVREDAVAALTPVFSGIAAGVGRGPLRDMLPLLRGLRLHLTETERR